MNYKRKRGHSMNTFTIDGKIYSIRLTNHAELRTKQRKIDMYMVTSAILALGKTRIEQYQNSDRDILIQDLTNNFAVVITIEGNTIYVITCIDHCDCWSKTGTTVVNL